MKRSSDSLYFLHAVLRCLCAGNIPVRAIKKFAINASVEDAPEVLGDLKNLAKKICEKPAQ